MAAGKSALRTPLSKSDEDTAGIFRRNSSQRSWQFKRAEWLQTRLLHKFWWVVSEFPLCFFVGLALAGYQLCAFVMLLIYSATNRTIESCEAQDDHSLCQHGSDSGDEALRNAPCPRSFIVNSRGRRLYYRVLKPTDKPPMCLLVMLHGYAAHFNRPNYIAFLRKMLAQGIAVATIDLEGHGYSEGLRGYLEDYVLMIDDVEQLADLISSGKAHVCQLREAASELPDSDGTDSSKLDFFEEQLPNSAGSDVANLPLFVGGQSMGGGLSLLTSHRLSSKCEKFRGCVLCCPAVSGHQPPYLVTLFLRYVVASLFPLSRMPTFLDSTSDASAIWKHEGLVKWHAVHDTWGTPGGLGWGVSMRWGTAASMLGMMDCIGATMSDYRFPLLLLHDPEDKVIPFLGSLQLLEKAPSEDKTLTEMEGSLHDLMCNKPDELATIIEAWVRPRSKSSVRNPNLNQ